MKARSFCSLIAALLGAFQLAGFALAAEAPLRVHIDLDRDVLPAKQRETAIVKICLEGDAPTRHADRAPVNVALVIDRSGSMAGDKIVNARQAAYEAVSHLAPDDIVSLIAFDTTVDVLVPACRRGDGRALREAIAELEPRGSTALYDGVMSGAAQVRRQMEDRRYVNRVILLSDGMANVGPGSPQELGRLGAKLGGEGIPVTTIGLGLGFNEDLMTLLAQRSDGNTYFVENSRDLPGIFAAELGDVLSVIARRVAIEITFPEGVRPIRLVGREGKLNGRKAELELNQVYGGQEKFVLVEVDVDPVDAGKERDIAYAEVRYDDAAHGKSLTAKANARVSFTSDQARVVQSANQKVQADYARNVLAEANDKVIALVDEGKQREAGGYLRERADALQKMASTYNNAAFGGMIAGAQAAAAKVEQQGLENSERKALRAESAQVRNQQSTTNSYSGR